MTAGYARLNLITTPPPSPSDPNQEDAKRLLAAIGSFLFGLFLVVAVGWVIATIFNFIALIVGVEARMLFGEGCAFAVPVLLIAGWVKRRERGRK